MTNKLNELTTAQKELMVTVKDEWINLAFKQHQNGIDKPRFEEGVKWLYNDLLKKPMPKIVYCDSWLSCLFTINILKDKGDSVGDSVRDSVGASVGDSVRDSVWDSVGDSVWDSVGASVRDSVRALVWDSVVYSVMYSVMDSVRDSVEASVWDSVWASVWASVRDSVGDSVRDSSIKNIFQEYSNYCGWSNFGWVAFYDFFERINILNNDNFKQYKKLIQSNCFNAYEYENIIFAIQPPTIIHRNNEGRLHNPFTYAIEFKDGYGQHYINGRFIPEQIFNKAFFLTKEDFLQEQNSDYKGAWYEILGQRKMMEMLGVVEVDTKNIVHKNGDIETVKLYKTKEVFEEIDNQPFFWVGMTCPSTGTNYLQGVEPIHKDALSAIASLSMFDRSEYSFDMRS